MPLLTAQRVGEVVRLELGGWGYGHGATVEQAADDLVARLLTQAAALRAGELRYAAELGPPDHAQLEFLWEIGAMAERGEDVRSRVFAAT